MVTLDQVQKMLKEREIKLIDRFHTMQSNANLIKKIYGFYTSMPSDSIAVSSALKTTNFPYGNADELP
jgi:hypothetical protein